jgi:hypothetical protein
MAVAFLAQSSAVPTMAKARGKKAMKINQPSTIMGNALLFRTARVVFFIHLCCEVRRIGTVSLLFY